MTETVWTRYQRKSWTEMLPWSPDIDMSKVSVSREDSNNGSPRPGDMIARNPLNYADQWLVSEAYFQANYGR